MKSLRSKIKILIVEDHKVVIEGYTLRLEQESDLSVCGYAANVHDALQAAADLQPDLVLVDLSLGDGYGIDFIRDLKIRSPKIPCLVLSMYDENLYAERALRAGAKGYVMKDQPFDTVIAAIRSLMNGNIYVSERVKLQMVNRIAGQGGAFGDSGIEQLTDREFEVLQLIGDGMRPRHIAEKLGVSVYTIDTYCKRIREKLNLSNMSEIIQYSSQLRDFPKPAAKDLLDNTP